MEIPCINCLTFAICKGKFIERYKSKPTACNILFPSFFGPDTCSLLKNYLRTKEVKREIPYLISNKKFTDFLSIFNLPPIPFRGKTTK